MSDEREERRFAELEALADEYAEAQATAAHLDQFKHSKKAMLMKDAERVGAKTAAHQEREAYAHPDYINLLEGLREATRVALAAKWKLSIAQMRFEAWRTKAANNRAAMNLR